MPSKKTEEDAVEVAEITKVAHEYQREDLNELRDKLNQVIEVVNNL